MDPKLRTARGGGAGPGTACGEQGGELEWLPFRAFKLFLGSHACGQDVSPSCVTSPLVTPSGKCTLQG